MSEHREPERWLESGVLSQELQQGFSRYARVAPAAARKERMLEQLAAQLGEPLSPAVGTASRGLWSATRGKVLAGSAVVIMGALSLWQLALHRRAEPVAPLQTQAEAPAQVFRVAPLASEQLAYAEEDLEEDSEEPVELAPVRPVVRRAAPRAPVASEQPVQAVAVAPPVQEVGTQAVAELTMLARARRALLNDPGRALWLSQEHARAYPRGTFEEEREVLAIESLLKLGREDAARARARSFEASFPQSPHLAHLAKLIANQDQ